MNGGGGTRVGISKIYKKLECNDLNKIFYYK